MSYTNLQDIKIDTQLEQIFYVSNVAARKTKAGKPFTVLTVRDNTGQEEVKIWGFDSTKNPDLKPKVFVKLSCKVKEYQNKPDLSTEAVPMIVPTPKDISPYAATKGLTDEEVEVHWAYLMEVADTVKNPYIKKYINIAMETYGERIKQGAASASNRGAYKGGLVEHYAKVMRNALSCVQVQLESKYRPEDEKIDRDVIIAAVLMHDIGKVHTYDVGQIEVSTTRCGRLIEHLPLSYAISTHTWIAVESELRREVPEELKDHINHCILAHHGQLEFGSPVKPKSIEAYIVHVADMMDSMTSNYAENSVEREPDEDGFVPGSYFSSRPLFVGL